MKTSLSLIQRSFLLCILVGCTASPAPTPVLTLTPSSEPKSTSTIAPTAASNISLIAGQWNYLFYHPGLKKVILVNGGPDHGKRSAQVMGVGWHGLDFAERPSTGTCVAQLCWRRVRFKAQQAVHPWWRAGSKQPDGRDLGIGWATMDSIQTARSRVPGGRRNGLR